VRDWFSRLVDGRERPLLILRARVSPPAGQCGPPGWHAGDSVHHRFFWRRRRAVAAVRRSRRWT